MKLLQEVARRGYSVWGILDHKGNVVSGEDHPTANTHSDLWGKVPKAQRHKTVEFAKSHDGSELLVRTCSRDGLINALNNWRKLPTGYSSVLHDHTDNIEGKSHYGDSTYPHRALLKMNHLLNEYD